MRLRTYWSVWSTIDSYHEQLCIARACLKKLAPCLVYKIWEECWESIIKLTALLKDITLLIWTIILRTELTILAVIFNRAVLIQGCFDTRLFWYRAVLKQGCFDTGLFWYRAVLIQGCFDTGLFWYRSVLIQGCFYLGLFWYRAVFI